MSELNREKHMSGPLSRLRVVEMQGRGPNTCFAPVLTLAEAPAHPHNVEHGTFGEVDGVVQPVAAPRFSRTPAALSTPPPAAGQHTTEVLLEWGFSRAEVDLLLGADAVGQAQR